MAMIRCISCGKEVSDRVPKCMYCGAQIGAAGAQRWTGIGDPAANGWVNGGTGSLDLTVNGTGQGNAGGSIPVSAPAMQSNNSLIPSSVPAKNSGNSFISASVPAKESGNSTIPPEAPTGGSGIFYMPGPSSAGSGTAAAGPVAGESSAAPAENTDNAVYKGSAGMAATDGREPAVAAGNGTYKPGDSTGTREAPQMQGSFRNGPDPQAQDRSAAQGTWQGQGDPMSNGSNPPVKENPLVRWFKSKPFGKKVLIVALTVLLGPPIIIGLFKGIISSVSGSSRSSSRSSAAYEQEVEAEEIKRTEEAAPAESTKIAMPEKASALKGESYEDVVKILEGAGFSNIKLVADPDLINGFLHDDGDVEKVSVGGHTSFSKKDSFDPDVEIVITYHTYPEDKKKEQEAKAEPTKAENTDVSASAKDDGKVTQTFKEKMDAYEAFFDEYIAFMNKYMSADETQMMSMMTDYMNFMLKYSEAMEALDSIDQDSLSAADLAYYTEVMLRIDAKLMNSMY